MSTQDKKLDGKRVRVKCCTFDEHGDTVLFCVCRLRGKIVTLDWQNGNGMFYLKGRNEVLWGEEFTVLKEKKRSTINKNSKYKSLFGRKIQRSSENN